MEDFPKLKQAVVYSPYKARIKIPTLPELIGWFQKTLAGQQRFRSGSQPIEFLSKHDNRVELFFATSSSKGAI